MSLAVLAWLCAGCSEPKTSAQKRSPSQAGASEKPGSGEQSKQAADKSAVKPKVDLFGEGGAVTTNATSAASGSADKSSAKPANAPVSKSARQSAQKSSGSPTKGQIHPSRDVSTVEAANDLKLSKPAEQKADALAHYAAGALYEMQRNSDKALTEFEAAFNSDPTNAELASKLGRALLVRKDLNRALPILQKGVAANPKNYDLQVLLAFTYDAKDQKPKAVEAARKANELDPKQIEPYQLLAGSYLKAGKTIETLRLLERGFKQTTDDPRYWLLMAELYALASKQPDSERAIRSVYMGKLKSDRTEECYRKAEKLAADDLSIAFRLAGHLATRERYDDAIAIYKKILEKRPDALDVRERLAYTYGAKKDFAGAIAQFEELIKRQPLNWQLYLALASFYEEDKKLDRAQANYEQALILNPKEPQIYLRLARLYLAEKRPEQAMQTLQRCRERFPDSPRVPYFFGLIYSSQKNFEKAMESYAESERMAKGKPEEKELLDSTFYFYYGSAAERAGKFERAVEFFHQSLKLNPENDEASNYLGYMYAEKGVNLSEAEKLIKQALKAQPKNGAFMDSLGWVYYRMGRYDDALKYVSEAAKTEAAKEDATVFEHLGDIYLKLGKKDQAAEEFRKGLKLEPKNTSIEQKLKNLSPKP